MKQSSKAGTEPFAPVSGSRDWPNYSMTGCEDQERPSKVIPHTVFKANTLSLRLPSTPKVKVLPSFGPARCTRTACTTWRRGDTVIYSARGLAYVVSVWSPHRALERNDYWAAGHGHAGGQECKAVIEGSINPLCQYWKEKQSRLK